MDDKDEESTTPWNASLGESSRWSTSRRFFTYTNGHTGQLAVELGQDLSDGLGSSSGGRDGVVEGAASGTPVLTSLGGSIDDQLVGGGGVDRSHESFDDAKLFVQDLGQRCEAVGRARRVGEDRGTGILGVVDTHHVHGCIARGGGDDDALAAALQVHGGLLDAGKDTGRFANNLGSGLAPWDLLGVAFGEELDLLSVNNQTVTLKGDFARVLAMNRIVLELVRGVLRGEEGVVDGDDRGFVVLKGRTANEATDTSKAIDSELGGHGGEGWWLKRRKEGVW